MKKKRTLEVRWKSLYMKVIIISIDGSTGNVYGGEIKDSYPEITGHFEIFMAWADEIRSLKVRTNADTPRDAAQAVKFGAEGIGLCRTEHMFFEEDRICASKRNDSC